MIQSATFIAMPPRGNKIKTTSCKLEHNLESVLRSQFEGHKLEAEFMPGQWLMFYSRYFILCFILHILALDRMTGQWRSQKFF